MTKKAKTQTSDRKPKPKRRKLTTKSGSYIAPERLYTFQGFMKDAGLSRTRIHEASRKYGIKPVTFDVGINRYVKGVDAIDYILKLSEIMSREKAGESVDKADG